MMMASSKVMPSSSSASANSDLFSPTPPPPPPLPPSSASTSISMDDLLRNIYDPDNKSVVVDDIWSDIADAKMASDPAPPLPVFKDHHHHSHSHLHQHHHHHHHQRQQQQGPPPPSPPPPPTYEEMTLEDFLAKAGTVHDDDVRTFASVDNPLLNSTAAAGATANPFHNQHHRPPQPPPPPPHQYQHQQQEESSVRGFSINGGGGGVEVGGRGKRRVVQEPVDRVAQQRQKRMIKNRESAARSRERKQAYTSELESLVAQLEEENSRLVGQQIEQTKRRFKQLMENLIPVEEKPRPPRVLRRTRSMSW